jgi:hypothetical protein
MPAGPGLLGDEAGAASDAAAVVAVDQLMDSLASELLLKVVHGVLLLGRRCSWMWDVVIVGRGQRCA